MKPLLLLSLLSLLALPLFLLGAAPPPKAPEAPTYKLALVFLADTSPPEWIFTINGSLGFKDVAALEKFLGNAAAGTVVDWDPGCKRMGGEPLLSDERQLEAFRAFCAAHGIQLVIRPGG